jgi:hypothetical protein|tara:strand:+ start:450 stop:749 length:300 start_codon:yes stop_codon:yes gene_type:complete
MTKFMSIIAILVSVVLYWTTANVCKYNFAIDKKTNMLNILSEEIGPSIKKAQVYYYKELDCTKVDWSFDYNRVVKNVETLTVMVYQSFTTDITGRSLVE